MTDLSVIILNWNTFKLVDECLRSLELSTSELDLDVIVVDNGSQDDSASQIEAGHPSVKIIRMGSNVGFAAGNNEGVAASQSPLVLLLNSDTLVQPGAIQALLKVMETQPRAGLVGARLLNEDGSFQAGYTPFPSLTREFLILSGLGRALFGRWYPSRGPEIERGAQQVDYVEGACLLIRRDVYREVGGLNEGYFMYAEDVELCYVLRQAGWQVWYEPAAEIVHLGGGSSKSRLPEREADLYISRVKYFRKHHGWLKAGLLSLMIASFTLGKWMAHGILRTLSRGRRGRMVASPIRLIGSLARVM